jgi:hypothetical protein
MPSTRSERRPVRRFDSLFGSGLNAVRARLRSVCAQRRSVCAQRRSVCVQARGTCAQRRITRAPWHSVLALAAGMGAAAAAAYSPVPLAAQQPAAEPAAAVGVSASEISMSRGEALLRLELAGARTLEVALRDNAAYVDGRRVGSAPRGGALDQAWRELLTRAMDLPSSELPQLLLGWSPAGDVGAALTAAFADAFRAEGAAGAEGAEGVAAAGGDTVTRLVDRIAELERRVREAEARAAAEARAERRARATPPPRSRSPLRYISEGLGGVFSLLVSYVVLFAIGLGVVLFGGRNYLEGVADTARHATTRSLFVGLAAAFMVIPAFIIGIIGLVISIVGIPGLLVWVPGFPLAIVLAVLLGYLAVGHAVGEAVAERRFYGTDWFQRGNSYYFMLSGLGLLLAFFLAGHVVHMAGPWLGLIRGMLMFLGGVATFMALAIGFGAVLLSRAGTRPVRPHAIIDEADLYREEAGV